MKPTCDKVQDMKSAYVNSLLWGIGWSHVRLPLVREPAIDLSMALRAVRKPVADGLSVQDVSEKK